MRILFPFVFVSILIFSRFAKGDDMAEMMEMLHNTCTAETGVSDKLIDEARKGNFAEDQNLKCYMKCYLAQIACIDEDSGDIDTDTLIAMMPPDLQTKIGPILESCGTKKGSDVCDTAFQTHKCWQAQSPSLYATLLN